MQMLRVWQTCSAMKFVSDSCWTIRFLNSHRHGTVCCVTNITVSVVTERHAAQVHNPHHAVQCRHIEGHVSVNLEILG